MTGWFLLRLRLGVRWSRRADFLFDPLAVAALASFIVAYLLFVDPPTNSPALYDLATGASSVMAAVFAAASAGALAYFPSREGQRPAPRIP